MARLNLSDNEIQNYLDRIRSNPKQKPLDENALSSESQKALTQYRSLYEGMSEELPVNLSENFNELVLKRALSGTAADNRLISSHVIISVMAAVFTGGAALTVFGDKIFGSILPAMSKIGETATLVGNYLNEANIDLGLLGLSALMFMLLTGIDHLYKLSKSSSYQS